MSTYATLLQPTTYKHDGHLNNKKYFIRFTELEDVWLIYSSIVCSVFTFIQDLYCTVNNLF